jgi:hypothetical protein
MAKKLMIYALAFFLLCAIASSIYFWYEGNHRPVVSKTEYVKVPEIVLAAAGVYNWLQKSPLPFKNEEAK